MVSLLKSKTCEVEGASAREVMRTGLVLTSTIISGLG